MRFLVFCCCNIVYAIHVQGEHYLGYYFLCLQVTPPESMTPRHCHSITATSLGPGLTEVLVFGGWGKMQEDNISNIIAETTILRFGEQLLVHGTQYMCQ